MLADKMLLNGRNTAETIIGHIKEFSALNALLHLLATFTAYQLNPIEPKYPLALSRS